MYTDGSATLGKGKAGAGWWSLEFEGSSPAGKASSVFTSEVMAMYMAIKTALELWQEVQLRGTGNFRLKNLTVLLDSVEANHAVTSCDNNDDTTLKCRNVIQQYQSHAQVYIQWIPSHCDILGNEKADMLAKHGATLKQPQENPPLSLEDVKSNLKGVANNRVKEAWEEKSKDKEWVEFVRPQQGRRATATYNRATEVASFRLRLCFNWAKMRTYT